MGSGRSSKRGAKSTASAGKAAKKKAATKKTAEEKATEKAVEKDVSKPEEKSPKNEPVALKKAETSKKGDPKSRTAAADKASDVTAGDDRGNSAAQTSTGSKAESKTAESKIAESKTAESKGKGSSADSKKATSAKERSPSPTKNPPKQNRPNPAVVNKESGSASRSASVVNGAKNDKTNPVDEIDPDATNVVDIERELRRPTQRRKAAAQKASDKDSGSGDDLFSNLNRVPAKKSSSDDFEDLLRGGLSGRRKASDEDSTDKLETAKPTQKPGPGSRSRINAATPSDGSGTDDATDEIPKDERFNAAKSALPRRKPAAKPEKVDEDNVASRVDASRRRLQKSREEKKRRLAEAERARQAQAGRDGQSRKKTGSSAQSSPKKGAASQSVPPKAKPVDEPKAAPPRPPETPAQTQPAAKKAEPAADQNQIKQTGETNKNEAAGSAVNQSAVNQSAGNRKAVSRNDGEQVSAKSDQSNRVPPQPTAAEIKLAAAETGEIKRGRVKTDRIKREETRRDEDTSARAKPAAAQPTEHSSNGRAGELGAQMTESQAIQTLDSPKGFKVSTESVRRSLRPPPRVRARKVRRVVRHIDPWSVLTFSVLFHLTIFSSLLLASVLMWQVAGAAGTLEKTEELVQELLSYESYELNGWAMFRAGVAIAGIMTLASTILIVILSVIFNLISDLIGGIRVTVVQEETVRVQRDKRVADQSRSG